MSSRTQSNQKKAYLDQIFGLNNPLLEAITSLTNLEGVQRMQVSPHEARILQFLVQLSKAKKIVELGTLYAYSTFYMAQALPQDGRIWTLDQAKHRHQKSQNILKNSEEIKKIHWVTGSALTGLNSIESQAPFDMIFIDADKAAYLKYLDWAKKYLKVGGLLVADNTFLFGAVYGESSREQKTQTIEVMKSFNKKLATELCWQSALIPTQEGLTVAIKV